MNCMTASEREWWLGTQKSLQVGSKGRADEDRHALLELAWVQKDWRLFTFNPSLSNSTYMSQMPVYLEMLGERVCAPSCITSHAVDSSPKERTVKACHPVSIQLLFGDPHRFFVN